MKQPERRRSIVGFVVQDSSGLFLSRTFQWVRHVDRRRSKGAERAWVHDPSKLVAGGDWQEQAASVLAAVYDPEVDMTLPSEKIIPFSDFLMQQGVQSLN